jgi:hypothetical protein
VYPSHYAGSPFFIFATGYPAGLVFVFARSPIQQSTVCFVGGFCFCGDYLLVCIEVIW